MDLLPVDTLAHYNVYQSAPGAKAGVHFIQGKSLAGDNIIFDDDTDKEGEFWFRPELTHATKWRFIKNNQGVWGWTKVLGIAEQPTIQENLIDRFMSNFGDI